MKMTFNTKRWTAIASVVVATALAPGTAQLATATPGEPAWQVRSGSVSGWSDGVASRGVVYAAAARSGLHGYDIHVTARDAQTGIAIWSSTVDGVTNDDDFNPVLAVEPETDRLLVTFESMTGVAEFASDISVAGLSVTDGRPLWLARYAGPNENGSDVPRDMTLAVDGSVAYVTGQSLTRSRGDDVVTFAIDASSGQRLWATLRGGRAGDAGYAIAISGENVYVAGSNEVEADVDDMATFAFRADDGRPLWSRRFGLTGTFLTEIAHDVAVSRDASMLYVTGQSASPRTGSSGMTTLAYRSDSGELMWSRRYHPPRVRIRQRLLRSHSRRSRLLDGLCPG